MDVVGLTKAEEVLTTVVNAFHAGSPFDLCIMDIKMPGKNGYDVAREVRHWEEQRGHSTSSRLPLMAFSSSVHQGAKKCRESGFDGFLPKPLRRERLLEMMSWLMGKKGDPSRQPPDRPDKRIVTQHSIREEKKHSVRILLAEDNPVNRHLAVLILQKAGYEVEPANNGVEAIEKVMTRPGSFDMIFMDMQMPEMDGLEATRQIRAWEEKQMVQEGNSPKGYDLNAIAHIDQLSARAKRIPIVAMTANAMKEDRQRCLEAGMDDYVVKPIKREAVYGMVGQWVLGGS
jgi:CheY-like chemotaxis protein